MDIRDTYEFTDCEFSIVTCPICGNETLDSFYICPSCGWEYDGTILDEDYSSANNSTILDYKKIYLMENTQHGSKENHRR